VFALLDQGARTTAVGVAGGLVGAFATSRFLSSWLVGVPTHDVVAFALAALAVSAVSFIACLVPARRASRIDPARALRVE
jgi:ABC-type antimicrobial peptide transport system permease subunit